MTLPAGCSELKVWPVPSTWGTCLGADIWWTWVDMGGHSQLGTAPGNCGGLTHCTLEIKWYISNVHHYQNGHMTPQWGIERAWKVRRVNNLCPGDTVWLLPVILNIIGSHYNDVIMGAIASQITSLTIVCSIVYSDADQRKHQSSASLAFVWGIHRGLVNSPHKWPVTQKIFPFDDVIMWCLVLCSHQTIS